VDRSFSIALGVSFGVHVFVALVLLFAEFNSTPPKPTPVAASIAKPIKATVVDGKQIQQQIDRIKKKKADEERKKLEAKRKAAAEKKRREQAAKRKKEQERLKKKKEQERKAAAAAKRKREKAAAEKRRQDELKRKAREKKAAEEKARRKKEQEKAKKEAERKRKQAAERKRKEKEARERAEQERVMQQQMAEEMAQRQQARQRQVQSELDRYRGLIYQTIRRNLLSDRSTMEGKSCKLTISLASSGFVTNVVAGKGDKVVCDAATRAIYKATTLPVSKDPAIFAQMNKISLTFAPEFD